MLILKVLSYITNSNIDSEYTLKSLADSIATFGAPELVIEIPSNVNIDLFGLRAKPVLLVLITLSISISTSSLKLKLVTRIETRKAL